MSAPDGLIRRRPEDHGTNPEVILSLLDRIEAEELEMHSLLVWHDGALITEAYWEPYGPDRLHMMHSITKSVTAMAVGLAHDDGLLKLDDPVIDYFPEHRPGAPEGIEAMHVRHLLTMTSGHGRGISGGYWRKLKTSWAEDFLRQPLVHKPGDVFVYDSACSYMLSAIVQRVANKTVHDYLSERVFAHIGVSPDTRWDVSPEGVNSGGNGLWCRTSDLIRIGVLHLQDGLWDGDQILSTGWVRAARGMQLRDISLGVLTGEHYLGPEEGLDGTVAERREGYGYQWWRGPNDSFSANGLFGQSCIVFERERAVVAFTAGMDDNDRRLQKLIHNDLRPALGQWAGGELPRRLDALEVMPAPNANWNRAPDGWEGSYQAESNDQGIVSLSLCRDGNDILFEVTDARGAHVILAGCGRRVESVTTMSGARLHHSYEADDGFRVSAWAAWEPVGRDGWHCLCFDWVFVETAFRDTVRCYLKDGQLRFFRKVNVNSSIRELPQISANKQASTASIARERVL
ncbi:serine hydrolase [uncultured Nitratireductor sp.]|uniref:serine hydrolase domain-containing protein n=1 Tax=uncultured Nitratireductor sp. TaxID=520953 RepID=UPI0025F96C5E|nr:serine hydrolase domain-containing protein [uncultured Nitratireductor sp.]